MNCKHCTSYTGVSKYAIVGRCKDQEGRLVFEFETCENPKPKKVEEK